MSQKSIHAPDYTFLGLVAALILFGFFMLASASGPSGYESFGDSFYFVKHQFIFGLIPGIAALLLFSRIPYTYWKRSAWPLFLLSLLLLTLVFIPGIGATFGSSRSWISIGGLFSLQPAEIVKLTFLFYLAAWLEKQGEEGVRDVTSGFLPFVTVLGMMMFLLALQPDVGTMAIIVGMSMVVYFIAGAPWKHLAILVSGGVGLLLLLIKIAPYRAARLTTFLSPELDPQGIGYHINQALLAIGSGGLFGLGYGHSRQKFQYLPEVSGDSIFAIIGEEMGFVIASLVVLGFLWFFLKAIKIAKASPDPFGRYLVIGIVSWIMFQAFVNIGSMVSIMPITGVTLPFISYGGTSLAVCLAAIGVILNISRYRNV